jgi:GT2 family glycosyltransferase
MILFDVIVPTYNRYDQLHEFFKGNASLADHPLVHFWFIDDCSPKFDASAIPAWNNITMLRMEKNRGQAYARNIAIEKGSAPYIISLDDDAWFEDGAATLPDLIAAFEKYDDAGCLMFNVATPNSSYYSIPTGAEIPVAVACGCAYRRKAIDDIQGFSGFLHSQGEETDTALRLLRKGWKTRQVESVKVFHNFDYTKRTTQWVYYVRHNTTRNDLLVVLMYYPLVYVPLFVVGKFVSHLAYAARVKVSVGPTVWHTFTAIFGFLKFSPAALRRRQALSVSQFNHWRLLFKQL